MIETAETSFEGYDCIRLSNSLLSLWVTRAVGPRVIGLSVAEGSNLFAVVPEAFITTPAGVRYQLRGGHRLWHAPEDPERTYVPDDDPLRVSEVPGGVTLVQPVEAPTGIEKQMTITLSHDQVEVQVNHRLTNLGAWPVELAPWAITQLRTGGFAILPQPQVATGLLPNRRLALWPYSHANAPQLIWGDRFILYQATMASGAFKIGWANPDGWLGYWIEDTLFVKHAPYQEGASYFDYGSSSECYCDPRFIELESLGPRTRLSPGESVHHRELWRLYSSIHMEPEETHVGGWIDRLGIAGMESGR